MAVILTEHGPITRTFSPPPRVNDPNMHHGTCVMHVPWCMPGSLTSGLLWSRWRGKRSQHSRCMCNPQFYVSGKRPMPVLKTESHSDANFVVTSDNSIMQSVFVQWMPVTMGIAQTTSRGIFIRLVLFCFDFGECTNKIYSANFFAVVLLKKIKQCIEYIQICLCKNTIKRLWLGP